MADRQSSKLDGLEEDEIVDDMLDLEGGPYDAKARRLQKNRESARESRLRKKNYMEQQERKCDALRKQRDRL